MGRFGDDDLDDCFLFVSSLYLNKKLELKKRKHRWWVHEKLTKRSSFGSYHHLVQGLELLKDKLWNIFGSLMLYQRPEALYPSAHNYTENSHEHL